MKFLLIYETPDNETPDGLVTFINGKDIAPRAKIVLDCAIVFRANNKTLGCWTKIFEEEYGEVFNFILLKIPNEKDLIDHTNFRKLYIREFGES